MKEFFASLYEWFGLMPLYNTDMGDHLRGWDISCSTYEGSPWYIYIGWTMLTSTVLVYSLQYHIIDNSDWNKKQHWWVFALLIFTLNFFIPFSITFNTLNAGPDYYCKDLNISISDCVGFGFSNAIWSFLFFMLISTMPLPRRLSTNCRNTTFWKP